jgi:hypothetical protein
MWRWLAALRRPAHQRYAFPLSTLKSFGFLPFFQIVRVSIRLSNGIVETLFWAASATAGPEPNRASYVRRLEPVGFQVSRGVVKSKATLFRDHAADCMRLAAVAKDERSRAMLMHMAAAWARMAESLEKTLEPAGQMER